MHRIAYTILAAIPLPAFALGGEGLVGSVVLLALIFIVVPIAGLLALAFLVTRGKWKQTGVSVLSGFVATLFLSLHFCTPETNFHTGCSEPIKSLMYVLVFFGAVCITAFSAKILLKIVGGSSDQDASSRTKVGIDNHSSLEGSQPKPTDMPRQKTPKT